jgi:hypothetical protein
VWNPNEFVEGYSNFLMKLLMAVPMLVLDRTQSVLTVQLVGMVFVLTSAFLSVRIYDHLIPYSGTRSIGRLICFVCVLFYYPLSYWSLMGMETSLLTVLLLLSILCALNYSNYPRLRWLFLTAITLGLAFLTRTFLIFAYLLAAAHNTISKSQIIALAGALVLYGMFVLAQTAFRVAYYGEFLPNTYTLKMTGLPVLFRLRDGIGFVLPFLSQTAVVFLLVLADIVLRFRWVKLFLASFILAALAYQIYVGGDPWSLWRIMTPAMPVTFVLLAQAIVNFADDVMKSSLFRQPKNNRFIMRSNWVWAGIVVALTLLALGPTDRFFWREHLLLSKPYSSPSNETNVNVAVALNHLTTENAQVGVLWAGAIPYYTPRRAVDFLGKTDPVVARLEPNMTGAIAWNGMQSVPGHNKYNLDYSIKLLQPTYVQQLSWGHQDIHDWAKDKYQHVVYRGAELWLLKDSPHVYWENLEPH